MATKYEILKKRRVNRAKKESTAQAASPGAFPGSQGTTGKLG